MARKRKILKRPATKKSKTTKKPAAKKRTSTAAKKTTTRKSTGKGVDSLLKRYDQQRVSLADELVNVRKKMEQLNSKIEASKSQLLELRKRKSEAEIGIATIDSRRDEEIGTLLAELGIDVQKAAAAAAKAARRKQNEQEPNLFEPNSKPSVQATATETLVLPQQPK